jgi:hypothetical protein
MGTLFPAKFVAAIARRQPDARALALVVMVLALGATAPVSGQGPFAPAPPAQQPTFVGLPVPQITQSGELVVRPNVSAGDIQQTSAWEVLTANQPSEPLFPTPGAAPQGMPESLPAPQSSMPGGSWLGNSLLGDAMGTDPQDIWLNGEPLPWDEIGSWYSDCYHRCRHQWCHRQTSHNGEAGIGREYVMTAPFEIDITQPMGNFRWRTEAVENLGFPDRSEYFWSRPGRGPLPEVSLDYQEFRFLLELGSGAFSLGTDVPIRLLNPVVNENTNGVGDIQLIQKTRMMDGNRWQMTQLLRTTFNNGNPRKGLGSGHVSMEPGMLFRFKYSDLTYLHSEIKMSFPIGGDPMAAAPLLKWGIGVSTIWYETDTVAWLPTLEFTNLWFLDGLKTYPDGTAVDVEAEGAFLLTPGLRCVCDTGGDLGVVELGFSSPVQFNTVDGWYDFSLRLDLRFIF